MRNSNGYQNGELKKKTTLNKGRKYRKLKDYAKIGMVYGFHIKPIITRNALKVIPSIYFRRDYNRYKERTIAVESSSFSSTKLFFHSHYN